MATTGQITLVVSVQETLAAPENHIGAIFSAMRPFYSFTNGVGVGQNDRVWSTRIDLAAAATAIIDLAPLSVDVGAGPVPQSDVYGNAVTFVEVTMIAIRNRETTAGQQILRFGPAAVNPFLWLFVDATDQVVIVPDGAYCQWSDEAQTVNPGAADSIRLINTDGANATMFDIIIVGRSA